MRLYQLTKKYVKVFLVAADNVDAGLKSLGTDGAVLVKLVTGGRVKQCGLLAYVLEHWLQLVVEGMLDAGKGCINVTLADPLLR